MPVLVLLAVLVLILATSDTADDRSSGSPLVGNPAPDVIGVDFDGASFDLRDQRGRWTLVNFFSTTCVPCVTEHPELVAWSERRANDARVVSVTFDDTASNVREFFTLRGGDWPVLVEDTGSIAVRYGVTGVPESYLVAPSGVVAGVIRGGVTADQIDAAIAEVTGAS